MAVIITDMDMPKGCWGCKCLRTKDPETNYCMLSGSEFDDRLDLLTSRQKDCPLRSADEMTTYYPPCEDCHKKMDEIRRVYDKVISMDKENNNGTSSD